MAEVLMLPDKWAIRLPVAPADPIADLPDPPPALTAARERVDALDAEAVELPERIAAAYEAGDAAAVAELYRRQDMLAFERWQADRDLLEAEADYHDACVVPLGDLGDAYRARADALRAGIAQLEAALEVVERYQTNAVEQAVVHRLRASKLRAKLATLARPALAGGVLR